ncbi:hypothetical protein HJC23_011671 [Cyclotella cryptica]|uniref:Uncharacterized protein n=1 Tax=Cyclotella cryptica TaxID=29204 RepID=A0ABD3QJU4_9STRA|eukprot:CCRYP_004773-RA/>CCRYP_004773-RA protein AED:0.03 eAED:0.03 QI:194/1/1/1/1/1/3/227/426
MMTCRYSSSCAIVLLFAVSIAAFSPSRTKEVLTRPNDVSYVKILLAAKHSNHQLLHERTGNPLLAKYHQPTNTPYPQSNLLSWRDFLPISLHVIVCLLAALLVSTYEDYDVTHTRPNPSTIRRPTSSSSQQFNYVGAATRGMGWGINNRILPKNEDTYRDADRDRNEFEEWYGFGATTLQWKPSYNEIMLQHRRERVTRWASKKSDKPSASAFTLDSSIDAATSKGTRSNRQDKEQLQQAVLNLYQSLDELEKLKIMADDYRWDEMKDMLTPSATNDRGSSIRYALEYSLDILKSSSIDNPSSFSFRSINYQEEDLPTIIGFDWGSCAWRHCGAKADAQEALAELYSSVGMLEPFECRFVIDIIERSIRDILSVVPDELKPHKHGIQIQAKPYIPYVSQADKAADGIGLDYEYVQALSDLRVDLSE